MQPDFSARCKISTVIFKAGMVPDLFCCPALGINYAFIWTPDVHGLLRVFEEFSGMQNEVLHVLIAGKLQKWMCHLKWVKASKIVSLHITCSSAWIVTLALKTCTSHMRLSLLKESLGNKTAFGSTEKLHSKKKEKIEGHALCKTSLLAVVNSVSVHSAWRTVLFWVITWAADGPLTVEMRNLFVCFGLALEDKRIPAQSAVQFQLQDITTINLKNPDQCSLSYYLITENLVKVLEQ